MNRAVVVTGANSGIGKALCQQLATEDGCFVFLGSRSADKGAAAIKDIVDQAPAAESKIKLLEIDVTDDASVAAAATAVKDALGDVPLFALVNNAGAGLAHGVTSAQVMAVNWEGPKRVVKSLLPLLHPTEGRVVNVGSGAGSSFVSSLDLKSKSLFCNCPSDVSELDAFVTKSMSNPDFQNDAGVKGPYGLSKACLSAWTMWLAKEHPSITWSCVSPGFIATAMASAYGATKPPSEGTVSTRHCLFNRLEGNGWFYGSDAVRSPYHVMRNPGTPGYDGVPPA